MSAPSPSGRRRISILPALVAIVCSVLLAGTFTTPVAAADEPSAPASAVVGEVHWQQSTGTVIGTITVSPTTWQPGDLVTATITPTFAKSQCTSGDWTMYYGVNNLSLYWGGATPIRSEPSDSATIEMVKYNSGEWMFSRPWGMGAYTQNGRFDPGSYSVTYRVEEGSASRPQGRIEATEARENSCTSYYHSNTWSTDVAQPTQDATFRTNAVIEAEPGRRWFHANDKTGLHEWTFGDGTTSDSFQPEHVFKKPGTYTVTHCRPPLGVVQKSCKSEQVTIAAPTLNGSVSYWADGADNSSSKFDLGQEFTVKLRVAATQGVGDLSAVDLDPNIADLLADEERLEVLDEPTNLPDDPDAALTLEPTQHLDYEWRVRAVKPGRFGASTTATGKDAAGRAVDPLEIGAPGRIGPLKVEVVLPDKAVELKPLPAGEDGDDAYEPAKVPVTVKVTVPSALDAEGNELNLPVEDVRLREQTAGEYLDFDQVRRVRNGTDTSWVDVVPQPVPMPARVTTNAKPVQHDGVLQPGESAEFTFMTQIDKPGGYDLTAIAEGKTIAAEDSPAESVTGSGAAVLPVGGEKLVQVEYSVSTDEAGTPQVTEGGIVNLHGTVRNLSPDLTVALDALLFRGDGPGFVVGPAPFEQPLEFPGARPVFAPQLAPDGQEGDEAEFHLQVRTSQLEGIDSSLLVNWDQIVLDVVEPSGQVIEEDGTERELDGASEVLIDVDKGRVVDKGRERARIGVTPAPTSVQQLNFTDFLFALGGNAAERFTQGAGDKALELPKIVAAMGPAMKQLGQAGVNFTATEVETYTQGALYMLAQYDYQTRLFLGMDTSTQKYLIDQTADELFPLFERQMKTRDAMRDFVNSTVQAGFAKADEIATKGGELAQYGWTQELAELYTEPAYYLGGVAVEETTAAMTGMALTGFTRAMTRSSRVLDDVVATEARLAKETAQDATEAVAQAWDNGVDPRKAGAAPRLRDLPGGTSLTPAQAIRGWAVDATSDQNLRAMTSKADGMPIIVAIRSRADETMQWMADHVGIELKPVTFKPKNVDWADTQFLGYRSGVGYGVGDRGATVLAEPLSRAEVIRRVDRATDLTSAQRKAVLDRHNKRWEEWYGVECPGSATTCEVPSGPIDSKVAELKELASTVYTDVATGRSVRSGRLDVPSRGSVPEPKDNWDTAGAATSYDSRRFGMRQIDDPEGLGREYWETWLAGDDGVMRRIAGDIDVVMVTDTSGRTLRGDMAERVAIDLQRKVGAQHPWSSTLSDPKLRKKFLDDHVWDPDPDKRGEPLLIYMNGESKVGWYDPSREILPDNPLDAVVWLDGGAVDADLVVQFQRQSRGLDLTDVPSTPGHKPSKVKVREALEDADARLGGGSQLAATCKVSSARPTATFVGFRYVNSQLQQRGEDGVWRAVPAESACDGGEIAILPDTASIEKLLSGQIRIPIVDELFGVAWKDLFKIGDCVTIDPGTPREESACIVQHGSLILDRPLQHDHPALTQIVLTPASSVPPLQMTASPVGITGTPRVGATLSAVGGVASAGGSVHRQWFRDGQAIQGAVGETYRPVADDVGRRLSVHVTAHRDGWSPATVASGTTAVVRKAGSSLSVKLLRSKVAKGSRAKIRITVRTAGDPSRGVVRVTSKGKTVAIIRLSARHRGVVTLKLKKLPPGRHKVSISYKGSPGVDASRTAKRTLTVRR